tara:strand:- start:6272 stop:9298 length:3027 start_codon:yes stop_codon:yes gene_type:complete
MLNIQLYIEGKRVELFKDESVTLTQTLQDVTDIKKVFTDYSRTMSVPASSQNNKIFKHFYNYFIDGFDARKKVDAQLFLNYKPFKIGKVKLEGTTLKNNKAHTYKITFYGNTVSLSDKLKDDKITILGELSAFDFSYTDTNILSYMTDGLDADIGDETITDGIIFPLITHTSRLTYDSSTTALNNIYPNTSGSNGVPLGELKPAIRLYSILKAMELHYSINFSRDFFNTTNEAFYGLYMWLHAKEGEIFVEQGDAHQVTGLEIIGTNKTVKGVIKKNSSFNIDAPIQNGLFAQHYRLRFSVGPALASAKYNLVINENGEEFRRFEDLTGTTTNGQAVSGDIDSIKVKNGDFTVFLESESITSFEVQIGIERRGVGLNISSLSDNRMLLKATTTIVSDKPITILQHLPDIKCIDFLTGLFNTFNLTSFIDDNNIIQVKTVDNFYASSTQSWNLTDHVDSNTSQVDSVIPYRQVNLGYKGLSTFLAENFKQIAHKEWGTLQFERTSKYEGSTYSIELPFEHALFEKLNNAANGDETQIQWGWAVDKSKQPTATLPLLFYANKPTSAQITVQKISGDRVLVTNPYLPMNSSGFFTGFNSSNKTQSLNFHAEIDEYALTPNQNTLFKSYYEDYIVDLFDVRKRITSLSAFIPSNILQRLSLADKIIVFDKQYRINKITTNFTTGKSNLQLTNLLERFVTTERIADVQIDIDDESITADNIIITVDRMGTTADGFDIPIQTTEIPNVIPTNNPTPTNTKVIVTPAIIAEYENQIENTSINFKYEIIKMGTFDTQPNIDEFGFLISDTSGPLNASNDIDVLKADSNITDIAVVTTKAIPSLQLGIKNVVINSLSAGTIKHGRFYVRTNTEVGFDKSDVISPLFNAVTPSIAFSTSVTDFRVRQAGFGAKYGYDTIPTHAQIRNRITVNNFGTDCGTVTTYGIINHNGQYSLPGLGDRVKVTDQFKDYSGGSNSWPSYYAGNKYFALAVFDNNTITKHIVVEFSNATVVAIYSCS